MKLSTVIIVPLLVNISAVQQNGLSNSSTKQYDEEKNGAGITSHEYLNILSKLEEIQHSDAKNAHSIQEELTELKNKQDNLEFATKTLYAQFEDLRKTKAEITQLLNHLSSNIVGLQSKAAYAEQTLNKTVNSLRIILQSAVINLGDLLITAVQNGDPHQVLILLDLGAPIEYEDSKMNRAIHVAAQNHHPQILEILLERRPNIEAQGEYLKTALHLATYNECLECARILIDKGAKLNPLDQWRNTPLMHPSIIGFNQCVELLLKSGADVNAVQEEGYTASHFAAKEDRLETLQLLAKFGADFRKKNVHGDTPLSFAKSNEHWEVASFIESQLKNM